MSKKNQIDMLHGHLLKKMILFAIPIAISSTLQQVFNATDVAVVGQFAGSRALAAVGSNAPVINLIINLLVGVSIGANVVIANYIGQGRRDRVRNTVHTAILVAVIGGVAFGILGILVSRPILTAMDVPEDVIDMAVLYLRIFFGGLPLMMLYNFSSSILRSKGDTTRPLICLVVSGIINVCLNLLLVAVFHLGVAGVAIATVTANAVSASMVLRMLVREKDEFRLEFRKLRIHGEHLKRMLVIGIPSGIQGMVFSVSNLFIQAGVNGFGSDVMAGSSAALNFEYFSFFVLNAFVQTAMTFTSQNFGAQNLKRCREICVKCLMLGAGCTLFMNVMFFVGREFFVGLFTGSEDVAQWAYMRMQWVLIFQWIATSYEITAGAMRGMGHSTLPAIITVIGTCLVRIGWILTIFKTDHQLDVLFIIYPISWVLTGLVMITAYFIVRWREEKAFVARVRPAAEAGQEAV